MTSPSDGAIEQIVSSFAARIEELIQSEVAARIHEARAVGVEQPIRTATHSRSPSKTRRLAVAAPPIGTRALIDARRHSAGNRNEVTVSDECGCFHCGATYAASDIVTWTDDDRTAVCPRCGVPSVLGDAAVKFSEELLAAMRRHWYGA